MSLKYILCLTTCFGLTGPSSGNTLWWHLLHCARLCQQHSLMYVAIILKFGVLRMSDLFLSSYCGFCMPRWVCRSPGRVRFVLIWCSLYLKYFFTMALPAHSGPRPVIQSRNHFFTVGRIPWTSDQPVARPLHRHRTTKTQNKRTETSMPWVGFEPTIPAFERAKRVHALDRAATVTGPAPS
jgi:hypothetical protein